MLKALHAAVFLGLAAATVALVFPEARQLAFALSAPYHFGSPPSVPALIAGNLAILGAGLLIRQLIRRKRVPLSVSVLILVAFALGLVTPVPPEGSGRSWAAADKEILEAARQVHLAAVQRLQAMGVITMEGWVAPSGFSPARNSSFVRVPYQVVFGKGDRPGSLEVQLSEDGVSFELEALGFGPDGSVAPLADEKGDPLVLRGTYNPEAGRGEGGQP